MKSSNLFALCAALAATSLEVSAQDLRVATYNASLNRATAGALISDLSTANNEQARKVAEILQRIDADVVLINEFDYDAANQAAHLFRQNYLAVGQNGAPPVHYPYYFTAPSNTGVATGLDLDNNGFAFQTLAEYQVAVANANLPAFLAGVYYGNDARGFGEFAGQYGMVVFSKRPILQNRVRTFRNFKWKDMPGAILPVDPTTLQPWFSQQELNVLPLSSKSHWDIPIVVGGHTVHILAAHPTPPVFDGAEDRNGLRNHDEIRFWRDYVTPFAGWYIRDDSGRLGGLPWLARFVIVGDHNADPLDGDSVSAAIDQVLGSWFVDDSMRPTSLGGPEAALLQGGANLTHLGDAAFDTADFADSTPGNLRVDYVLPSRLGLTPLGAGIFWPVQADPLSALATASDHRLVFTDIRVGWLLW